MKSLFDPAENERIVNRIHQLSVSSMPQWGKMNVAQMLSHCQQPLLVAFGELQLKKNFMGVLFGGMVKRMLIKKEQYKHGMPTANEFIIADEKNFEKEKQQLIELVQRFVKQGRSVLRKDPHPFFGKLTPEEWDIMQWKHLDHHLRQFAL